MNELLTTKEACEYLKVHRRTLYRMMKDGRLPFEYITGSHRIRVRKAHLDALLVPGDHAATLRPGGAEAQETPRRGPAPERLGGS